jgi:hypothetical protein
MYPLFQIRWLTIVLLIFFSASTLAGTENADYTNFGYGSLSGDNNAGADDNTAIGQGAMSSNLTSSGDRNTAVGHDAMYFLEGGYGNVAVGDRALYSNYFGYYNTAIGTEALKTNETGGYNVAVGYLSGYSNQTGSKNIFLGYEAGYNETGSDKLYIDNSRTATPLIYGDFASDALTINGTLNSTGNLTTSGTFTAAGIMHSQGGIVNTGTLTSTGNISTSGTLTAAGNVIAPAFYHTDGTKMLSIQNSSIHLGASSMIFTDSSVSGNADIMHSSSGKIQLGNSTTDSTTVVGSLNVETPTQDSHAANKSYVDKVAGNAVDVDALRKDMRRYDSRSVALSSALTALPTNGGTGSHACGIGAGVRGEYSAMAMGCAADLENFELPDALPSFIRNASINAGTSFLTHDDPDYTFKVGMSFNFGGSKSRPSASHLEADFARELALVHQKTQRTSNKQAEAIKKVQKDNHQIRQDNREMKRDNLRLQAKVNALRSDKEELLALRAEVEDLKTDKAEMLAMKAQLAQLTVLIAGTEMVASK